MSQNVQVVGVTIDNIATEIDREKKRQEFVQTFKPESIPDSVRIESSKGKIASPGDASDPKEQKKDPHAAWKDARSALEKAFKESGFKFQSSDIEGEKILERGEELLSRIGDRISKLDEEEAGSLRRARLERIRDKLTRALEVYRSALGDLAGIDLSVAAQSGEANSAPTSPTGEKEWGKLFELGLVKDLNDPSEKDLEKVGEKIGTLRKFLLKHSKELRTLEGELKKARETFKNALTVEEKKVAEAKVKELEQSRRLLTEKSTILRRTVEQGEAIHEELHRRQVSEELGIQSVREEEGRGQTVTQNAVLGINSAGGEDRSTGGAPSGDTDPASASSGAGNTLAINAANDFSGTTLMIQSQSSQFRAEARKTDQQIKKLLRAAMAGNWEACKICMILLDKRSSQIMIGMGVQTIKAMQFYEQSMAAQSANLTKLNGTEPDYNAKLAKINSEMNIYSQNRQAISNFLRDIMSMREAIGGDVHSIITKDGQTASRLLGQ